MNAVHGPTSPDQIPASTQQDLRLPLPPQEVAGLHLLHLVCLARAHLHLLRLAGVSQSGRIWLDHAAAARPRLLQISSGGSTALDAGTPLTKVPAATCRACSTRSAPQSGRSPPASAMAMERMR